MAAVVPRTLYCRIHSSFQTLYRTSNSIGQKRTFHSTEKRLQAKIIDGKAMAKQIRNEIKEEISSRTKEGHKPPHLTAVLVGNDPASETYVRNKIKACNDVGITSNTIHVSTAVTQDELLHLVDTVNDDASVDGLLVQLPLPEHIGVDTFAKTAVVCGRSKNVGMPIAMLLHTDHRHARPGGDATVTMTHRFTPKEQLKVFTKQADIVIVAAGKPNLITADMIKEGACVIDVGINRIKDEKTGRTKLVGDVDFEGVRKVAGHITPVPGGVGPMTVAMLCRNTLIASKEFNKAEQPHSTRLWRQ